MFWTRLRSPENHNPNVLKRSPIDFVEATSSQKSGSRKYAKNASMNSSDANDHRGPRPPGRRPTLQSSAMSPR